MQQPFAAAMVAGQGLYTRRGKATQFAAAGEWVAIHCGQNDEHLNNPTLLAQIRKQWPACPTDSELRAQQRCLLGVARFVDGAVSAASAAKDDFCLAHYDCTKPVAWRADAARKCTHPIAYPKGNLQVWHLAKGAFGDAHGAAAILELCQSSPATSDTLGETAVKAEEPGEQTRAADSQPSRSRKRAAAAAPPKLQASSAVKAEARPEKRAKGPPRELADLGPAELYRPTHRGATVTARKSNGPPAPRRPLA